MQRKVYLLNCTGIKAFCEQEGRMEELFLKVDDARRKKAEKIRDFGTACMSLAAGLLLQKVLEEYHAGLAPEGEWTGDFPALFAEITEPIQVKYRTARGGKPYFAKLPICFSLSHSGEYVFAVADHHEVGVDIQKKDRDAICRVARRFYAQEEMDDSAHLNETERMDYLYRLWTMKEAYGKLTGQGVAQCLSLPVEKLRGVSFSAVQAPEGYEISICNYLSGEEIRKGNG